MSFKEILCTITGALSGIVSYFFGGWTMGLATLVFFMAVDFVTGLLVAGIFKKSDKTETGALSSKISFKGLCKKFVILCFVAIAYRLDVFLGVNFLYNAVGIGFLVSELISIVENAGMMGITSPAIAKAIDLLRKRIIDIDERMEQECNVDTEPKGIESTENKEDCNE